jgi:hypothetical protein
MTPKLNNEGVAARFVRTAKPSPEQDTPICVGYVRLIHFPFLIMISCFVTLEE